MENKVKKILDSVSKCIYDLISRTYALVEAPIDTLSSSFNKFIERPEELPIVYNPSSTNRILASCKYIDGLERKESIKPIGDQPKGETQAAGGICKNMEQNTKEIVKSPDQSVKAKKKGLIALMKRKLIK